MAIRPSTPTLSGSTVQVLNYIRNSASTNYKEFVPYATPDADVIKQIGAVLMQSVDLRNEFLTNLVNRIGKVIVTSKLYRNPWNVFKKGELEYGETVEEIFVGLAKAAVYDPATAKDKVFARSIPDVRAAFHVRNCELHYDVTVQREDIKKAFITMEGVVDLITRIIEQIYTAAEYDEFNIMKYLLACHALDGHITVVNIPNPNSEANIKEGVISIKTVSNRMTYMNPDYNLAGVRTHTLHEDQYVIIDSAWEARQDVNVLAAAFHMDKAEYLGHRIGVDGFGLIDYERLAQIFTNDTTFRTFTSTEKGYLDTIKAVIVDRDFFQIYDNLNEMEEIRNPLGLYTNYFFHHWSIYSVSPFSQAAAFVVGDAAAVSAITITPSTVNVVAGDSVSFSVTSTTTGLTDETVTYTISGAQETGTYIDDGGNLYIDPDEIGNPITVTATSNTTGTVTASATVYVLARPFAITYPGTYSGNITTAQNGDTVTTTISGLPTNAAGSFTVAVKKGTTTIPHTWSKTTSATTGTVTFVMPTGNVTVSVS